MNPQHMLNKSIDDNIVLLLMAVHNVKPPPTQEICLITLNTNKIQVPKTCSSLRECRYHY